MCLVLRTHSGSVDLHAMQISRALADCEASQGPLDIIIANAGIGPCGEILEMKLNCNLAENSSQLAQQGSVVVFAQECRSISKPSLIARLLSTFTNIGAETLGVLQACSWKRKAWPTGTR